MFYIYIILGLLLLHCTMYYLNIDVFQLLTRTKCEKDNLNVNVDNVKIGDDKVVDNTSDNISISTEMTNSIETSINELKNLNQYIDNELGQTSFC